MNDAQTLLPTVGRYLLARLRESSTWRGLILLVASGWAAEHPDLVEQIVTGALGLVGLIGMVFPDVAPGANRRIGDPQ